MPSKMAFTNGNTVCTENGWKKTKKPEKDEFHIILGSL